MSLTFPRNKTNQFSSTKCFDLFFIIFPHHSFNKYSWNMHANPAYRSYFICRLGYADLSFRWCSCYSSGRQILLPLFSSLVYFLNPDQIWAFRFIIRNSKSWRAKNSITDKQPDLRPSFSQFTLPRIFLVFHSKLKQKIDKTFIKLITMNNSLQWIFILNALQISNAISENYYYRNYFFKQCRQLISSFYLS